MHKKPYYKVRNIKWENLRIEYIHGDINLKELAAKHKVKYSTVLQAAYRGKWTEQRSEFIKKVIQDTYSDSVELRQKKIQLLDDSCLKIANNLLTLSQKLLKREYEKKSPSVATLSRVAQTVKNAQIIGRLALGIGSENIDDIIDDKFKHDIVIEPTMEPKEAAILYLEMIESDD